MTQVLLHVGTPRTGSTSLQHFLFSNQELLKELGWVYYPEVYASSVPQHAQIWQLMKGKRLRTGGRCKFNLQMYLDRIQAQAETANVILSCEALAYDWFRIPERSRNFLTEHVHKHNWSGSLFVREKDSFATSLWKGCRGKPKIEGVPEMGTGLTLESFRRMPYLNRWYEDSYGIKGMFALFPRITVTEYSTDQDTVAMFMKDVLGYAEDLPKHPWLNRSPQ